MNILKHIKILFGSKKEFISPSPEGWIEDGPKIIKGPMVEIPVKKKPSPYKPQIANCKKMWRNWHKGKD